MIKIIAAAAVMLAAATAQAQQFTEQSVTITLKSVKKISVAPLSDVAEALPAIQFFGAGSISLVADPTITSQEKSLQVGLNSSSNEVILSGCLDLVRTMMSQGVDGSRFTLTLTGVASGYVRTLNDIYNSYADFTLYPAHCSLDKKQKRAALP